MELNAQEEKALAYSAYEKAAADYNEYINTHKIVENTGKPEPAETEDTELDDPLYDESDVLELKKIDPAKTEDAASDASLYDESAAMELKNAMDAAQSAYEMVVREQDKLIKAAADSFQQAKEDINLEQGTKSLEDRLERLRAYLQSKGQYLAENSGIVSKIFVESGTETMEGAAVLIANSSEGVRLSASFSEEYREEITETSTITLKGENLAGVEENHSRTA